MKTKICVVAYIYHTIWLLEDITSQPVGLGLGLHLLSKSKLPEFVSNSQPAMPAHFRSRVRINTTNLTNDPKGPLLLNSPASELNTIHMTLNAVHFGQAGEVGVVNFSDRQS